MAKWQSRDVFGCLLLLLVITGEVLGGHGELCWVRFSGCELVVGRFWINLGVESYVHCCCT